MEQVQPAYDSDERTMLIAFLDFQRATLLRKVAGLTEEQARWSPVPSGTSLFGLLSHMTHVERWWCSSVIGGLDDLEYLWTDDDPEGDWQGPPGATLADVAAAYEAECARSNAILRETDLERMCQPIDRPQPRSARWILVHMVEETARHLGHADVIREQIDGATGD